jgi:hypothetical protein
MASLHLSLVDLDPALVAAWAEGFRGFPEVTIRQEDLLAEAIARRPEGHLPVGASLVVRTGHPRIPYLIVAPTMVLPEAVSADHCYRAMRAVLRESGWCPRRSPRGRWHGPTATGASQKRDEAHDRVGVVGVPGPA